MAAKFKFCPFCGTKLRMAYPGAGRDEAGVMHAGDPESGPAAMRCTQDRSHGGPIDLIEDAIADEVPTIIGDFLDRMAAGQRDAAEDPPVSDDAMAGAAAIKAYQEACWIKIRDAYGLDDDGSPKEIEID